jgi:TonB-linked SusC/RagA family outer membrane protein
MKSLQKLFKITAGQMPAAILLWIVCMVFLAPAPALAVSLLAHDTGPQMVISGKVTDENGDALPGVSIIIKGKSVGTVTDASGNYNIEASSGDILVFSFVGYASSEVTVNAQSTINVKMEVTASALDEVVVIGYGSQSKRELTSAVSSIVSAQIREMPVVSIDQTIQGRAPGVVVVNNTGEPGGGVTMRIRGTSTIGSGSDPLFVVDGIPLDNDQTGNRNVGEARVNGLSQINPADIESMEILKDAAATAIYGARASNGVVLITTKRGSEGVSEVSFDSYAGVSHIARGYDVLGASDFAQMVNEGMAQLSKPPVYSQAFINNPDYDTDWQDQIFRTAKVYNANISMRGGNKSTGYMVSGGYMDQEGTIVETRFKRYSMRANIDHKINNAVKIGANIFGSVTGQDRSKNDGSANATATDNLNNIYGPPVLASALVASPAMPIYDANGDYEVDTLQTSFVNPVRQARAVNIHNSVFRLLPSVFLNAAFTKRLMFTSRFSADIRNETEDWFNPPSVNQLVGADGTGQASQRTYGMQMWTFDNYMTYDYEINANNKLSVMLGTSQQRSVSRGSFVLVSGIVSPVISTLNSGTDSDVVTSDRQAWALASFFGRINYDLNDRYLFNLNARYDGSSRFGQDNRFGFFPSASAGWRLSSEEFMQDVAAIKDLKIRASWGITGNQSIGNYASRSLFNLGTGTSTGNNYSGQTGVSFSNLASENLGWEQTTQTDIGIDASLFNRRLNITADYYIKQTDRLLFSIPLPQLSGFPSIIGNVGKIENRGFELNIESINMDRDGFRWSTTFNIATNQNKVLELLNDKDVIVGNNNTGFNIARVGQPISFYLYQREKYVNAENGTITLMDQTGNGIINAEDLVIAGSPFPKFFGGITNNLSYRNFDLALFFQYNVGNKIYNVTRRELELMNLPTLSIIGTNTTHDAYYERWQNPGDETEYPRLNYNGTNNQFNLAHDGWLEDGSYIRLKTFTLGYTLSRTVLDRAGIRKARIYASSNNLLTFTKYKGLDPEVNHFTGVNNASANSALLQGYDYGTYPQARSFVVGLNLTF